MKNKIYLVLIFAILFSCKNNSETNKDLADNSHTIELEKPVSNQSFTERLRNAPSDFKGALAVHFAGSNITLSEFKQKYNDCKSSENSLTCAFFAQSDYDLNTFKARVNDGNNKLSSKALRLNYAISKHSIEEFEKRVNEWKGSNPDSKQVAYYFAQSKYSIKDFKDRLELGKTKLKRGQQYIFAASEHKI